MSLFDAFPVTACRATLEPPIPTPLDLNTWAMEPLDPNIWVMELLGPSIWATEPLGPNIWAITRLVLSTDPSKPGHTTAQAHITDLR